MKKSWLFISLLVVNTEVFAELRSLDDEGLEGVVVYSVIAPSSSSSEAVANVLSTSEQSKLHLEQGINNSIAIEALIPHIGLERSLVNADLKLPERFADKLPAPVTTTIYTLGGPP